MAQSAWTTADSRFCSIVVYWALARSAVRAEASLEPTVSPASVLAPGPADGAA